MTYRPYFRRLTMPKVQNIFSNYFCSKVISAAAGLIYHLRPHDHINDALATLHWLRVPERSANVQSSVRQRATISGTSCRRRRPTWSACSAVSKYQPLGHTANQTVYTVGSRAFPVAAAQVWNGLPEAVTSSSSLQSFRRQLKTHLCQLSYPYLIL